MGGVGRWALGVGVTFVVPRRGGKHRGHAGGAFASGEADADETPGRERSILFGIGP